MTGRKAARNM